jgi:peroxin-1
VRNIKVTEPTSELDYVTLAGLTEGYSASDLNDFVTGANQQAMIRCARDESESPLLTMDDFVAAQEAFTPFNLRGVSLQKSDVRWADIGGLHDARQILRETLEWPTKYARIFANCPLRLRSGLLLYGYPGCGKTLLASAVARECGLNFISVKGPEILNKYIGQSEQSVRDLFERASAAKPCVLFFDEFDSIAPKRGHDSTGVTDRVVNQMLTEMDGAQGLDGVYVLAATSRPDLIDPALLRPGRLDKSILCDMPSQSDRLEIIESFTKKLHVSPTVDYDELAADSDGLSGADLQALVYNAHLEVVHAVLNKPEEEEEVVANGKGKGKAVDKGKGKGKAVENSNGKGKEVAPTPNGSATNGSAAPHGHKPAYHQLQPAEVPTTSAARAAFTERIETIIASTAPASADDPEADKDKHKMATPVIEMRHLRQSLQSTRPSVSPQERARFDRIYSAFVSDRDGNLPNGDLGRDTGTRSSLK